MLAAVRRADHARSARSARRARAARVVAAGGTALLAGIGVVYALNELYSASPEPAPSPPRSYPAAQLEQPPPPVPLPSPEPPMSAEEERLARAEEQLARAEEELGAEALVRAEEQLARAEEEKELESADAAPAQAPEPLRALPTAAQVCCAAHTQFPVRMLNCGESELHEAVALASTAVEFWKGTDYLAKVLDGIVKLTYDGSLPTFFESLTMISPKPGVPYVSDHDGARIDVRTSDGLAFSIVTQNLEGLCRKGTARRNVIVNALGSWFRPHVQSGMIMVIQELALQLNRPDAEQRAELDANLAIVLETIDRDKHDLAAETDGYTGCLIYDKLAWTHQTVKIARARSNKFSNAHLMSSVPHPARSVWVVNIHLKAFGPICAQATIDAAHTEELTNILRRVLEANVGGFPVYLCGDFNNASNKGQLVQRALDALVR